MQKPQVMSAASHQHAHDHDCGHGHHHHHAHAGLIRTDALLSARGVSFARGGRAILEHVDIDIGASEIVTLIGPNGAGKTTLVRVLLGLEKSDSGTIARRPDVKIGYVPQRFDRDPAIPVTVERFLSLGLPDPSADMAAVLAEVGASQVAGQQ